MSVKVAVIDAAGERIFDADDLPLAVGAGGPDGVVLSGDGTGEAVAFIGATGPRFFVQPGPDAGAATVDGRPLGESVWIDDAVVLVARGCEVRLEPGDDRLAVTTAPDPADRATLPPAIEAVSPAAVPVGDAPAEETIAPATYTSAADRRGARRRRFPVVATVVWAAAAVLGAAAWFMFTARSVEVLVAPAPESVSLSGGLVIQFGPRYLLRPGEYRVEARLEGYEPLDETVTVGDERAQTIQLAMERLGDRLFVETPGVEGATVLLDGEDVGRTPLAGQPVRPGRHRLEVVAERYVGETRDLDAEGGGNELRLVFELVPDWAPVGVTSTPEGATVLVGEAEVGLTPTEFELASGSHELTVQLDGYKTWRQRIEVEANTPLAVPPVSLEPADGRLRVLSEPGGATLLIDGRFQGRTPVTVDLEPGRNYRLTVSQAGYRDANKTVRLKSGDQRRERFELEMITGVVLIDVAPADALLSIDGGAPTPAPGHLQLIATPHRLEFSKPGYVSETRSVTPAEGLAQRLQVRLMTLAEAELAKYPPRIETAQGAELIRVPGGQFRMGSDTREVGRRANEGQRRIELSQPFYIGVREVTNREFNEFRKGHRSGTALGYGLELDDLPVVRVSWQDAAAFCNWLSDKDGLPAAFRTEDARLVPIWPPTTGYRLPTEAEWAWAMRYGAAAGDPPRYPWGDSMPPSPGSGNFGDESARAGLRDVISGYRDDYPVTAPVGRFARSALGLYDGGGNVSEWTLDLYRTYTGSDNTLVTDPKGAAEGRYYVIRGSSFRSGSITELRWAYRDFGDEPRPDLGFRLARSIK